MSERAPEYPPLRLQLAGKERELTERNTSLYTFLGRVAVNGEEYDASRFDHVFVRVDDDEGEPAGVPIFREHGVYEALAQQCIARGFPLIMNMRRVPPGDVKAYFDTLDMIAQQTASTQLPDEFNPEDWQ